MRVLCLGLALASAFVVSCGAEAERDGPSFQIAVAPLTLSAVTDATYDLRVYNSDSVFDATTLVWSQDGITSSRYGDSRGSISYIGPCDASVSSDNTVELITVSFTGDGDFILPCPASKPCRISKPCDENADTFVEFNLTVMRNAQQGFFDVAVNFEDIFCSAKVDCLDVGLLHAADGRRGPTVVVALACTGGPGAEPSVLVFDDITLACEGAAPLTIPTHPAAGAGNQLDPALASDDAAVAVYQVGIYQGVEALACLDAELQPVSCQKVYTTTAIGVGAAALGSTCTLTTTATAGSGDFASPTPAFTSYPLIEFAVRITDGAGLSCGDNPLGAGTPADGATPGTGCYADPPEGVCTAYTDLADADGVSLANSYPPRREPVCGDGALDAGEACDAGAQNGVDPCGCSATCTLPLLVPAPFATIGAAVDAATDGDTICVAAGSYPEAVAFGGKRLTLLGVSGSAQTFIEGDDVRTPLTISGATSSGSLVRGFTLRNGVATNPDPLAPSLNVGGGAFFTDVALTLDDLVLADNASTFTSGAIYARNVALVASAITLRANTSTSACAGFQFLDSTIDLDDWLVENNAAGRYGGGGCLNNVDGTLDGVDFVGNDAGWAAGGLTISTGSVLTIQDGRFVRNDAGLVLNDQAGGGLEVRSESIVSLRRIAFLANTTQYAGGGMVIFRAQVDMEDIVVAGNYARTYGGGIDIVADDSSGPSDNNVLRHVTIVGNRSGRDGAGIRTINATTTLDGVIVYDNLSDLAGRGGVHIHDETATLTYCAVTGNLPQNFSGVVADPSGTDGNVSTAPEFVSYSGADPTLWDLHLVPTSTLVGAMPDGTNIGAYPNAP